MAQTEMQACLPREAHGAVNLKTRLDDAAKARERVSRGPRNVVHARGVDSRGELCLRDLDPDVHVSAVMLDGLEGPDGAAELLTRLGVVHRVAKHTAGPSHRFGQRQRAQV